MQTTAEIIELIESKREVRAVTCVEMAELTRKLEDIDKVIKRQCERLALRRSIVKPGMVAIEKNPKKGSSAKRYLVAAIQNNKWRRYGDWEDGLCTGTMTNRVTIRSAGAGEHSVVNGHGRMKAASEAGIGNVPVRYDPFPYQIKWYPLKQDGTPYKVARYNYYPETLMEQYDLYVRIRSTGELMRFMVEESETGYFVPTMSRVRTHEMVQTGDKLHAEHKLGWCYYMAVDASCQNQRWAIVEDSSAGDWRESWEDLTGESCNATLVIDGSHPDNETGQSTGEGTAHSNEGEER